MTTLLSPTRRAGFTLIELLIVVAIISVLAAIAVPNFIEAQTRCKVARTAADHRAINTALEAYRVDTNRYPTAELFSDVGSRMVGLTTPIAYLTSLPRDTFYRGLVETGTGGPSAGFATDTPMYVYASGNIYFGQAPSGEDSLTLARTIWSLAGRGPDGNINGGGYCMAHPQAVARKSHLLYAYDATNGTVSEGDIMTLSSSTMGAASAGSRDD